MKKLLLTLFLVLPLSVSAQTVQTDVLPNALPNSGTESVKITKTTPYIQLQKWNGEVNLGLQPSDSLSYGASPNVFGTTTWGATGKTMTAYQKGDGFEIDIALTSKPSSNIFSFSMDNWANLNFYYQSPLANANPDGSTWEGNGHSTSTRPANVTGSYAVYYSKRNYIIGQTNYGTGKAFNIYRPLVSDALGSTTWASLSYATGTLSVIVPQNFLDNATYPVTVDPNFGYTTIGGTKLGLGSDTGLISDGGNIGSSGTVSTISTYVDTSAGTCNMVGDLYDGANPNNREDYTAQFAMPTTAGWTTKSAQVGFSVVSGTDYWVGIDINASPCGNLANVYYDAVGASASNSTYSSPPPATFTRSSSPARNYSAYITYTAAASPASTFTPFTVWLGQMFQILLNKSFIIR